MVYHGDVKAARDYFYSLGYTLPSGENVADWLIDIASGTTNEAALFNTIKPSMSSTSLSDMDDMDDRNSSRELNNNFGPDSSIHYPRFCVMERGNSSIGGGSVASSKAYSVGRRPFFWERSRLASSSKYVKAVDDIAKLERRSLNICWVKYLRNLDDQREYLPPSKYALPEKMPNQSFLSQLQNHMIRNFIVSTRNLWSRLLDSSILVLASALVCCINGTLEVTNEDISTASFNILIISDGYRPLMSQFSQLFNYAMSSNSDLEL